MDLVGMDVRERRKKQKITVVTREAGWSSNAVGQLLTLRTEVSQLPTLPKIVLLYGEYTQQQIEACVVADVSVKIVTGLDNPELPFKPSDW